MTVAVTGPFASGKSTFTRMLGEAGAETVSSDELVHDLYRKDPQTARRVAERFGDVLDAEGKVDRLKLRGEVFGDPEALRDLEGILHPLVREETDRRVSGSEAEVFVAEIPLLFETGRESDFDLTVTVLPSESRRREWAAGRGVDAATLRGIEARQLSPREKARRADVVVENDGTLEHLRKRAVELMERLRRERSLAGDGDEERRHT
ncbi:TIGR00152: dephospho-CoA kinase [Rubrobacter radiotolerans]|uniref:Dephospho-CoA kinase n=1 Tax=Rubrobacter radiotolerans TaxID=42256 RepID=A0A023X533_RUBRA|nr:dephospho-CoA kinase [Rubrobacter radiotolerans]AHY47085.1 TIGR00152: dephospho-CoA kinase [Rubrobacter radiotolerans]SMC06113.1 dephospho-CoA kinase [Rubrobacter radiotolerans DSM 5868]